MAKKKELNYESAMQELQGIVNQLQEETVGVDELSEKVKRAGELVKFCQEKLRQTEEEVSAMSNEK